LRLTRFSCHYGLNLLVPSWGTLMSVVILIFMALAVTYWMLIFAPDRKRKHRKMQRVDYRQNPFHAVSIRHSGLACSTVIAVGERRFIADKVSHFPLPNCNVPSCSCRYVHHEDRRELDERRIFYSLQSDHHALAEKTERRSMRGRRRSDNSTDAGTVNLTGRYC
jgi:hypothetical protein